MDLLYDMFIGHGQADLDPQVILSCNYENETDPFCGFTQDTLDDFDWTRQAGTTSTENTGPSVDHTYGSTQGTYTHQYIMGHMQ